MKPREGKKERNTKFGIRGGESPSLIEREIDRRVIKMLSYLDTCVYLCLFNEPFPIKFPPSVSTSLVSKFTCNSNRRIHLISLFFFSIKTLSSKSVVFEERTVCLLARFTPAESGEIKLYRPPVFGIFPSLSNSPTRFLKIYEPARDLTPFCESLHVAIRLLLHSTDFHENCGTIIVDFSLL